MNQTALSFVRKTGRQFEEVFDALALPLLPPALFAEQVMEDAAISERITRALRALAPESTAPLAKPAAASAAVPARRAAARRRSASP